jgi:hypothetical protein
VTFDGPAGGTGTGTVRFTVAPTDRSTIRSAVLTIAGQLVQIVQAGQAPPAPPPPPPPAPPPQCTYTVEPTQFSVPFGGENRREVRVRTGGGCRWTAVSQAAWITITDGAAGSGDGTVRVSVEPNLLPAARTGTLSVATQLVTVTQDGLLNPEVTLTGTIESLAGRCPDRTFTMSGERVSTDRDTDYPGRASCRDLRNGRSARVEGLRQPDGSILATRVDNIGGGGSGGGDDDGEDDLTFSRTPEERE